MLFLHDCCRTLGSDLYLVCVSRVILIRRRGLGRMRPSFINKNSLVCALVSTSFVRFLYTHPPKSNVSATASIFSNYRIQGQWAKVSPKADFEHHPAVDPTLRRGGKNHKFTCDKLATSEVLRHQYCPELPPLPMLTSPPRPSSQLTSHP